MQPLHSRTILLTVLGLFALGQARADEPAPVVLIDAKFDRPTGSTITYPPVIAAQFRGIANGWSGWGDVGSEIALTYGDHLGINGTGGIYAQVMIPARSFMSVQFNALPFPMLREGVSMTRPIRSMLLEFDAKIPAGRVIEIKIAPNLPRNTDAALAHFSNRLNFGSITGTGEFVRYRISGEDLKQPDLEKFIRFINDLYLNQVLSTFMKADLSFTLITSTWMAEDAMHLDNVNFTIAAE